MRPAWARLPDYKTTRPPLSLLNVSKGFHCLLKSALVPPKTAPHTLSQNGASFLDSGFLCSACVVPVVCAVGTRAELASKNQDLRDVEKLSPYYYDPMGDLLR